MEKRRLHGDLTVAFQLQKVAYKKAGEKYSHKHAEEGQRAKALN